MVLLTVGGAEQRGGWARRVALCAERGGRGGRGGGGPREALRALQQPLRAARAAPPASGARVFLEIPTILTKQRKYTGERVVITWRCQNLENFLYQ